MQKAWTCPRRGLRRGHGCGPAQWPGPAHPAPACCRGACTARGFRRRRRVPVMAGIRRRARALLRDNTCRARASRASARGRVIRCRDRMHEGLGRPVHAPVALAVGELPAWRRTAPGPGAIPASPGGEFGRVPGHGVGVNVDCGARPRTPGSWSPGRARRWRSSCAGRRRSACGSGARRRWRSGSSGPGCRHAGYLCRAWQCRWPWCQAPSGGLRPTMAAPEGCGGLTPTPRQA